jgi:hypothetical protein
MIYFAFQTTGMKGHMLKYSKHKRKTIPGKLKYRAE